MNEAVVGEVSDVATDLDSKRALGRDGRTVVEDSPSSTLNKKIFVLRLLSLCAIGVAVLADVLVLERLTAAILELYKFYFQWPSPIFLSQQTVIFFGLISVTFSVALRFIALRMDGTDANSAFRYRLAFRLMTLAPGILAMMLMTRLATI